MSLENIKAGDKVLVYGHWRVSDRIRVVERISKRYIYLDGGSIWNNTTGYEKGSTSGLAYSRECIRLATDEDEDRLSCYRCASMIRREIDNMGIDVGSADKSGLQKLEDCLMKIKALRAEFKDVLK